MWLIVWYFGPVFAEFSRSSGSGGRLDPAAIAELVQKYEQHPEDLAAAVELGSRYIELKLHSEAALRLAELKKGIEISAFSHVGRIRVGDLSITVLPKLKSASLLRLLRYAFGFRPEKFYRFLGLS